MKYIFSLISILCFFITQAQNNAGTLDSSFGNNGKVLTSFLNSYAECRASAETKAGDIIAAGRISAIDNSFEAGLMAVKYSADGSLDTTFGNKGLAIPTGPYEGYAVAVQPDNKIIVAGVDYGYESKYIVAVRFNADGSVDSGFGENGRIINLYGTIAFHISLQEDGKIVFSGTNGHAFVTLRYLENGTIDESFGSNGLVMTDYNSVAYAQSNIIQPDGKIVVAGDDGVRILLARYNQDGSLDQGFGLGGLIILKTASSINNANCMTLQPDGKIIIAGAASNFVTGNVQLIRFLSNGSLDSSFGNNGIVVKKLQYSSAASSVGLQSDGKILICGSTLVDATYEHFLLERFIENGRVDSSFGINGIQITEIDQSDGAIGITIQANNKILVVGQASSGLTGPSLYEIALARYNNDDLSKKQLIITKIKKWLQHHNGFTWDGNNSISSYAVQRSYDGVHWSIVHSQPSTVSSSQPAINYYNDPSPLNGTNYYRLQTTGVNNVVGYSNIIAVPNSDIKISPNPAKNILQIQGLPSNQKAKITVVDFAGNEKLQTVSNNILYNLNTASLKAGNYLLKIEMNDEVVTKKFMKE